MSEIRGEYWIQDGHVEFADEDIGDTNHEMIANNHVLYQYVDAIINLADEMEIDTSKVHHYGDIDSEAVSQILGEIEEKLDEEGLSIDARHAKIMQDIGCNNKEAYDILWGGGNGRLYVMKYEGWIAIRGNNIELFGYDDRKRMNLVHGISEILENESIEDDVPTEEIEFWIEDHKTNRSHHVTLAELEQPITMRAVIMPQSIKKLSGLPNRDSEENKGQNPSLSIKNKWTQAAQDKKIIPPGHDLWRGTSEGWLPFSKWVNLREQNLH